MKKFILKEMYQTVDTLVTNNIDYEEAAKDIDLMCGSLCNEDMLTVDEAMELSTKTLDLYNFINKF